MSDKIEGLSHLGGKTEYKDNYAPEVLEAFDNKHPERDYWVASIARNLPACARSQDNLILPPSTSIICRT